MSRVLAWAENFTCAIAGCNRRQRQPDINVLNGRKDPMISDLMLGAANIKTGMAESLKLKA